MAVVVGGWASQPQGEGPQVAYASRGRGCEPRAPEAANRATGEPCNPATVPPGSVGGPGEKEQAPSPASYPLRLGKIKHIFFSVSHVPLGATKSLARLTETPMRTSALDPYDATSTLTAFNDPCIAMYIYGQ